ncbi:MAG: hypothetical protein RLZZ157_1974, partial [Pseudomonadota bacterium]
EARIVRALQVGEEVRIIGQTDAGQIWYVLRLADGSQGFAPRAMFRLDPNASRWVYPDGTVAPGPNIPKGATTPVTSNRSANRPSPSSGTASDTDTATPAPNPNPNTTPPTSTQSPTPITPPPPGAPVNLQPN